MGDNSGERNGVPVGPDYLKQIQDGIDKLSDVKNFNRVAGKLRALQASPQRVVVELTVEEEHVNHKGTLHGGQTAALTDIITAGTVALTTKDTPMVSVEISVSYMLPVKLGEIVDIEAVALKIGRNIAFAEANFRRRSDGALVAKGKHTIALLHHLKEKAT